MKILAIDPGTHLGWATNTSGRLEWGEQDFSLKRGESPGMRFHHFNAWLRFMFVSHVGPNDPRANVDLVVFEVAHMRGGYATDLLVGITTRIVEFCAVNKIEHAGVHSSHIKKFALGKGRGDKPEMVRAAGLHLHRYHGASAPDAVQLTDNMADALWLYWYAQEQFTTTRGTT